VLPNQPGLGSRYDGREGFGQGRIREGLTPETLAATVEAEPQVLRGAHVELKVMEDVGELAVGRGSTEGTEQGPQALEHGGRIRSGWGG
jgi:hypothetical protein